MGMQERTAYLAAAKMLQGNLPTMMMVLTTEAVQGDTLAQEEIPDTMGVFKNLFHILATLQQAANGQVEIVTVPIPVEKQILTVFEEEEIKATGNLQRDLPFLSAQEIQEALATLVEKGRIKSTSPGTYRLVERDQ